MRKRCNVAIQTSVDDTTVVFIYTAANWIQVHLNFIFANPEWTCSDDLSVSNPKQHHILHATNKLLISQSVNNE